MMLARAGVEPYRILVVDDEPLNREIIAEHLDEACYALTMAEDGLQAWDVLDHSRQDFDLVILDRMMPRMDGVELLGRIKSDARFADLPVIMQTAATQKQQVLDGIRHGAFWYLPKPFDRDMLMSLVEAALALRQSRRQLQRRLDDVHEVLAGLQRSVHRFRSPSEARRLAAFLSRACPAPEAAVVGLSELMVNAVEHGNLGIGYAEKGRLMALGAWAEEVERRLALPELAGRAVDVIFERHADRLEFRIRDEGQGFDWRRYLTVTTDRAFDPHGRGIPMARLLSFDSLEYNEPGNEARAVILLKRD